MSKFVIDNVLIEKSDKDIQTGFNYQLSDGFNLICGNNEAGKSSLMNFIKYGFLKEKDNDKGKIYFKVDDKSYRADIDGKSPKNKRLVLFEDNVKLNDDSLIQKFIDDKYLKQAFTINLDNLMSIKIDDKVSLANVIKDPLSDKLNVMLDEIRLNSKKIFTENNQLSRDMQAIVSKIKDISSDINQLSLKETEYNCVISEIKMLEEELALINKNEQIVEQIAQRKQLENELYIKLEEYNKLQLIFNEKFYENKDIYLNILEKAGKYDSNVENLRKLEEKYQEIKQKLTENINRLNIEFSVNMTEADVNDYSISLENIKRIKELLKLIDNYTQELNSNKKFILDCNENMLQLNADLDLLIGKLPNESEIESTTKLYKYIDEGINQYNYVLNEISQKEDKSLVDGGMVKKLRLLFSLLFVLAVIASCISFYFKSIISGSVTTFVASLVAYALFVLKNSNSNDEKERLIQHKNNILKELEAKVSGCEKVFENTILIAKCNSLKQELQVKLKDIEILQNDIREKTKNIKYQETKLNSYVELQTTLEGKIDSAQKEIKQLINSDNSCAMDLYIDFTDLISDIKNDIKEKNNLEKEIALTNENNEEIKKQINAFICENNVDIHLTENLKEIIEHLKQYESKQITIKNDINMLNLDINRIKEQISLIEYDSKYDDVVYDVFEKDEKQKQLDEARYKKKNLESFEGISNLKLQKNTLISELREKAHEVMKYKMILSLCNQAKRSFDKTQPDLINAQNYLSIMTEGKYTKINLDLEEISNDDNSVIKKWNELSRGTKEQLYLALRLGYASNYSKDNKTMLPNGKPDLPLIIDDAFVNFDISRTKNALKCLVEFSKTNQVLFFTCHLEVIKKLLEEIGLGYKYNLVSIKGLD